MKTRKLSKIKSSPRTLTSTNKLLTVLNSSKIVFHSEQRDSKTAILAALSEREITNPKELVVYHDLLLFIRAYPDDQQILDFTEQELQRFADRVKDYTKRTKDKSAEKLIDSGIVNTSLSHTFGYEVAQALHRWYPETVEIDWDYYNEEDDPLLGVLSQITAWNESDSLDNDPNISGQGWFEKAGGKSPLHALLQMFKSSTHSDLVKRSLYEGMDLYLKWALTNCDASRTLRRIPSKESFFQAEPIKGRTKDLRAELNRSATPLTLLPESEGIQRVRDIQELLAVRNRELFPLAGATPKEVYVVSPGRGLDMYIYGTYFNIRLPLEANFGAMLVRNGVPIGYGVAAVLLERVEIAINIFPAYRNGESSFIIEEFFRIFYHHFSSQEFLVRAYQIGDENDEALQSGSYWFYYKLGFRSVDPSVRKLADVESKKIQSKKGYRTPLSTLKKLAKSDMFLTADPLRMGSYKELSIVNLSYQVTRWMGEQADSDRQLGTQKAIELLKTTLPLPSIADWSSDEKEALNRLAPLVASFPDLASWLKEERQQLTALIRAKGSVKERDFVLRVTKHPRFQSALRELAEKK